MLLYRIYPLALLNCGQKIFEEKKLEVEERGRRRKTEREKRGGMQIYMGTWGSDESGSDPYCGSNPLRIRRFSGL